MHTGQPRFEWRGGGLMRTLHCMHRYQEAKAESDPVDVFNRRQKSLHVNSKASHH